MPNVSATKPQTISVQLDRIPQSLQSETRFVGWRWTFNPNKGGHHRGWDKPLLNPKTGALASSTNPETWATFQQAAAFMHQAAADGIGFNLLSHPDIVVHDLDDCRNPKTGEISAEAMSIVRVVGGYWEVTPSGTGIRGICRGNKTGPRVEASKGGPIAGAQYDGSRGRYVTLTGHRLPESTPDICDAHPGGIEAAYALMFPVQQQETRPKPIPLAVDVGDAELLAKAGRAANADKVNRLWSGDTTGYGSESEADEALCCLLAYWTGGDGDRIDRLFRQSGLYRDKWDREDYRARTIQKALERVTEFYQPGRPDTDGRHLGLSSLNSFNSYPNDDMRWPDPPPPEAFYGIAGDVVAALQPHTEADPVALLVTLLSYFGNAIGKTAHAVAEADRHGTNFFAVLVGETARGRKGSSSGHIQELFRRVDPDWASNRIMGGLSSGEGLIWAVRDPITKTEPIKQKGKHTGQYQTYEIDPGISDKRLLVYESEFAGVLRVITRETNTLSALIRQAWDRGDLRTLTKNSPAQATGAHISIIGHITRDELLRYLDDVEVGNGFANRFLWICVKRSQMLPEGGGTPDYGKLVKVLHGTLEGARRLERIVRDDQTREAWARVYPELSEGKSGLYGAITARAEAQVLRLSTLYAALDVSEYIRLPHLKAALALWQYAEASAQYIFGNATGDPIADRILEGLEHGELTRTAISHLFQRNVSAERIDLALRLLHKNQQAVMERRDTNGRPVEVWRLP